jgi:hypothetical protein
MKSEHMFLADDECLFIVKTEHMFSADDECLFTVKTEHMSLTNDACYKAELAIFEHLCIRR